jgi:SPP1 family predicted phage head-tail adaptor
MVMRIGRLRHRLELQSATMVQDASGEETETWATIDTIWGNVAPVGRAERFVSGADQQLATITHRVEIRYRTNITNEMRFKWGARILDIEGYEDPSTKQANMLVACREHQP